MNDGTFMTHDTWQLVRPSIKLYLDGNNNELTFVQIIREQIKASAYYAPIHRGLAIDDLYSMTIVLRFQLFMDFRRLVSLNSGYNAAFVSVNIIILFR